MKFKFKTQPYQQDAVTSICRVFKGQPYHDMVRYTRDLGIKKKSADAQASFFDAFEENDDGVKAVISSIGPYCTPDELKKIELKGYRTEAAKRETSKGSGLGLYLSRYLADMHNIQMEITSKPSKKIGGIEYGPFEVALFFPTSWQF